MCWRCIQAAVCVRWPTCRCGKIAANYLCVVRQWHLGPSFPARDAGASRARRAVDACALQRAGRRPSTICLAASDDDVRQLAGIPPARESWEADRARHGHSKTFGAGVGIATLVEQGVALESTRGAACWRVLAHRTLSLPLNTEINKGTAVARCGQGIRRQRHRISSRGVADAVRCLHPQRD